MPYYSKETIAEVKKIDLLTYLENYEPYELVKLSETTQLSDDIADKDKKPSVKETLNHFKKEIDKQKSDKSKILDVAKNEHQTPKIKIPKER